MRDYFEPTNPLLVRVENALRTLKFSRGQRLDATSDYSVSLTWPSVKKGRLILKSKITSYPDHGRAVSSVMGERVFEENLGFFQKLAKLGLRIHKEDVIANFKASTTGKPNKTEILILDFTNKQQANKAAEAIKYGYA